MALILAVAVAGFVVAGMLAERDVQRDSERRAEVAAAQIHGRIAQAASLTESLRRFMLDASGTGVTSDQFARNAFRWLSPADFPAAAWVEPVPDSQRAAYERRIGQPVVTPDEGHSVVPAGLRSSYLAATLVSGFPPLALPGIDLSGEPDMATALDRATHLDRVTATPVAGPDTGTNGLFLVAPAPNLVGESLRPGYVVVFVPDMTLRAAANTPGLRLAVGGTGTGGPPGEQTVRTSFTEAGQRFDVILPRGSVQGAATALPRIILACGLVLAGLAAALGINAARRARAQNELDRIFNLSPDLIAVANFERHFTRVNPAVEQILGYTRDELLARPYLDFVHPDDRERTAAEAAAISQGKTTLSFENRYLGKDGSYRVLEWTATPVVEENVMYSVARDVTERRRAEIELERLAGEQAALRRVATLVAGGAPPEEVFTAVTAEVGRLLEVDFTHLGRYDPDGAVTTAGVWNPTGGVRPVPGETRWSLGGWNVTTLVFETGQPARIDDYGDASGAGAIVGREWGFRSAVGVPISVEGQLWGFMLAAYTHEEPLPVDTDARLARFTELVATAIANAEGRAQLEESRDELRGLADEQAALRRVATLVAHGVRPEEIFAAVSDEVARLVGTDSATVMRYDDDGPGIVFVGVASNMSDAYPLGARWEFHDGMASAEVYRTGRSARGGARDWSTLEGPVGETHHRLGIVSTVASPIVVEGRLWGAIAVQSQDPLPMDTDERLEKFTELVGTAIANADSKSELAASRRRVITAADDARRRIERDLHDGTQQRLVSLSFALRMAQSTEPSNCSALQAEIGRVADELAGAIEELRELARGIHPAVLSKGGLGPALRGLARRAALPVELDIRTESRAADRIEVAAYYVVSEALTNTTKHARASCARVLVEHRDALLHLSIRDDGIGGADPAGGSGLIGLRDRAEALSGSIEVNSPPGGGTEIVVELPLYPPDRSTTTDARAGAPHNLRVVD